eukprot:jgi/Ulvmu1/3826/UM018_0038.1
MAIFDNASSTHSGKSSASLTGWFGSSPAAQAAHTKSSHSTETHARTHGAQGHSSGVFVVGLTMTVTALAALM